MPNIVVKSPEGIIPPAKRQALTAAITQLASDVEQIGNDPRQQALTWVFFEDIQQDGIFAGGQSPLSRLVPIMVMVHTPEGVVGPDGKARFISGIDRALRDAVAPDETRTIATSIIVGDVSDGDWGANGVRFKLADFARVAGYRHLRHLT